MINIVLTGFMGTGKSAAGRSLSRGLGLKFLDIDEIIEKEAGVRISEIFANYGESYFRKLEGDVIRRLVSGEFGDGIIVSTGGGAAVSDSNRKALKGWGTLICLKASVDEILKRVGNRNDRPLLAKGDKKEAVEKLLKERESAYMECGLTIDTTSKDVDEVVGIIKDFLKTKV